MLPAVDIDAYFKRIGGRRDDLPGLLAAHMRAIPFENLDVLLGRGISLDLPAIEAKLVAAHRGGYCYEHSTLFAAVLRELGYPVKTHSARVVMQTPRERAPRTHMFLTVGDVMLDPGFGGRGPLVPVPLDGTAAGAHRLVLDDGELALYLGDQRLWISSFEHDLPVDFEMANHYTSTHPASPFTKMLLARAYVPGGEVRIFNREVTLPGAESRPLADRTELRAMFAEHFGFDLPELLALRIAAVAEWT